MGITVADLVVKARADTAHAEAGLGRLNTAGQKTGGIFKTAAGTALGFIGATVGMAAASGGFNFVADAAVGMNAELETSTLQFTTLMGDADRAEEHVRGLFDFAAKTPFETGPIIAASKHLQVFGGDALNTEKNLTLVGDAAAAMGVEMDEVAFWTGRAYNAIQAGKPFGESAARLQEMGILTAEARRKMEELQAAGASNSEVWKVMNDDMARTKGAMELQAGTWDGMVSTLMDGAKMIIANAFKPLFESGKGAIEGLIGVISSPGFQAGVTEFVGSLVSGVGTVVGILAKIIPVVIQVGSSIAEWLGPKVSSLIRWLSAEVIPPLMTAFVAIGAWVQQNGPMIGQVLGQAFGAVVNALKVAWPILVEVAKVLLPAIGWAASNLLPVISFVFGAIGKWFEDVGNIVRFVFTTITTIWSKVGPFFTASWKTITTVFAGAIRMFTGFVTFVGTIPGKVIAFFQRLFAGVVSWITRTQTSARTGAANLVSGVVGFIGQLPGKLLSILGTLLGNVSRWFAGLAVSGGRWALNVVLKVVDFFRQLPGRVIGGIQGLIGKLGEFFRGLPGRIGSAIIGAGKAIVSGLWNGIASLAGWLWSKVSGLIGGIVDNVLGFLGIGSPSKLFAGIGRNVMYGLGEGIAKNSKFAERAMAGSVRRVAGLGGFGTSIPAVTAGRLSLGAAARNATLRSATARTSSPALAAGAGTMIVNLHADRYVGTREEARMYAREIEADVRSLQSG